MKLRFSTAVVLALVLVSCEPDTSPIPDFLPTVGISAITPRAIADITDPEGYAEATYLLLGPLLTGFRANSTIRSSGGYSMDILDSSMEFDILPLPGGSVFHFQGTMADGSGWINVYYDQAAKTFSFDQCLYVHVPDYMDVAIHAEGTDIQLDQDGYFHALYDFSYVGVTPAAEWELVSMTAEIYRGEFNAAGEVGTGFGFYSDADSDASSGSRGYWSPNIYANADIPGDAPATVSAGNLADWEAILSSAEVLALDNGEESWEIHYKLDDAALPAGTVDYSMSGNVLFDDISDYLVGFTDNPDADDLSAWGAASLIGAMFP